MGIKVTRPQATVEFITDAALALEHENAKAALSAVMREDHSADTLAGSPRVRERAEAVTDLEQRIADSVVVFTLQAVSRKVYNELVAEHPAREGNADDKALGVNGETFFDALISASILRVNKKADNSVVDFDPADEWSDLADEMTDGQYAEFVTEVQQLNRGQVRAPFPFKPASVMQESGETSI